VTLKVELLRLLVAPIAGIVMLMGCVGTGKPRPAHIADQGPVADTSGNVAYVQTVPSTTRVVRSATYQVGMQRAAAVGEPMFTVRNYTAAERVVGAVAVRPFRQLCKQPAAGQPAGEDVACRSGRLASLRGNEGDRFGVAGAITEAGSTYYMVRLPAPDGLLYLALDTNGRPRRGRYAAWSQNDPAITPIGIPVRWQDTPVGLDEEGPLFRFETAQSVAPERGNFVHYEVVYRGVTMNYRGMVFHLLYREYSSERADVPLYEQDLEYAAGVSTIDVLGLRLRVHDVNESQIVYTVVSD